MITTEKLLTIEKEELSQVSKELNSDDLAVLVEWLSEKDDKIRYQSLLLLQNRSQHSGDVYPYWDTFKNKLNSGNSYQRSIGLMMIVSNVKWDKDNRYEKMFDEFFSLLHDEKPITVRQCIQSLHQIIPYKVHLHKKIAEVIMAVDILQVKETMRKLVLLDILDVLVLIRNYQKISEIDHYISNVLLGAVLDKKAKKNIEAILR